MTYILVVEDERAVLENTLELLHEEGFDVEGARDGEEAYRKIITAPPDLILCDVLMPRLDGLGLLSRLAQAEETARIPVIFLTALTERNDLRAAMELGADDYITKPFTRDDLLEAISSRLDKRRVVANQTRVQISAQYESISQSLPSEFHKSVQKMIGWVEGIEEKANQDAGLRETVQALRGELVELAHKIDDYIYLIRLTGSKDRKFAASEGRALAQARRAIEEIAQATAWQYDRSNDLDVQVADGALYLPEVVLQRIVEEMLISAFTRTGLGERVALSGSYAPGDGRYTLRVEERGKPFTAEQAAFSTAQGANVVPNVLEIGIGPMLVWKLVEQYHGHFHMLVQADGVNRAEVVFSGMVREDQNV